MQQYTPLRGRGARILDYASCTGLKLDSLWAQTRSSRKLRTCQGVVLYSEIIHHRNPVNWIYSVKRINFAERYALEFEAQAFNAFNHPQFLSGKINTIDSAGDTAGATSAFLKPGNGLFNQPEKVFPSNSRTLQLALKFTF